MARPKKNMELRKEHRVTVRFRAVQYEIVSRQATELGIPVAEYVRRMAVRGRIDASYPIVADLPELKKLTNEFSAIGNNLNQIARYFNMGGARSRDVQEEINACIAAIMQMRKEVLEMAGDFHGNYQAHHK